VALAEKADMSVRPEEPPSPGGVSKGAVGIPLLHEVL